MLYKTITLEMLQEEPALYEELRSSKRLLPALEAYATELRDSHLAWVDRLNQAQPGRDPAATSSEAMELAIASLSDHLRCASPKDGMEAREATPHHSQASPLA